MKHLKDINRILFIVQARTGSTRVKNKMTREISKGVTLFSNVIDIVKNSKIPHKNFFVSINETPLINVAKSKGVNIFKRSKESANESIDLLKIFEWHNLDFDHYIIISACCPFLKPKTINNFIDSFINNKCNGMMSVVCRKNILWDNKNDILNYKTSNDFQTQTLNEYYEAAHCLYAGSMNRLKENSIHMGKFIKKDPMIFEISEEEAFDIDNEWQFNLVKSRFTLSKYNYGSLNN